MTKSNVKEKTLKLNEIDDLYLNIGSLRYTPSYIISLVYEDKKNVNSEIAKRIKDNIR